jgi:hypothetical protein
MVHRGELTLPRACIDPRAVFRRVAIVIAVAGVATLQGCALNNGSALSAQAARDALYAVIGSTEQAVGGTWQNQDDPTSRGCVIPLWVDGILYPALRIRTPPVRVELALAAVRVRWSSLGYSIESAEVGGATELKGTNAARELLLFRVSPQAMTLQGESECRPAG